MTASKLIVLVTHNRLYNHHLNIIYSILHKQRLKLLNLSIIYDAIVFPYSKFILDIQWQSNAYYLLIVEDKYSCKYYLLI
jgi:hypothetical protein